MAKKQENPYEIDEESFKLDSNILESSTEKELKDALDKLKKTYSKKRSERLAKQKNFIALYVNARKKLISLKKLATDGKIFPDDAIESFKKFVVENKWEDTPPKIENKDEESKK